MPSTSKLQNFSLHGIKSVVNFFFVLNIYSGIKKKAGCINKTNFIYKIEAVKCYLVIYCGELCFLVFPFKENNRLKLLEQKINMQERKKLLDRMHANVTFMYE
jgi:hypothetical protein